MNFGKGALFLERAISYAQIFAAAALTTSVDLTIGIGNEAEGIFRYLYGVRPDIVALPFADYLHSVANFHSRHSRPKLALAASSECIQLYGQVPFIVQRHGLILAHALADHARFAANLQEWNESVTAEESVLHYLRTLNTTNPRAHDHRIFRASINLRQRLKASGDDARALDCTRELENFIRSLINPSGPAIQDAGVELLADVTFNHGVDASKLGLWGEARNALQESLSIQEGIRLSAGLVNALLELSKCVMHSDREGALQLSGRAVDVARALFDDPSSDSPIPLANALSHHARALFLLRPADVLDAIAEEEENLAIRTEMALSEAERPFYDIAPEPTAQLLASLSHLHVYLKHIGRQDDASVAFNRINLTCQSTAPHIPGLKKIIFSDLVGSMNDAAQNLSSSTRDEDAQTCLDVAAALEAAIADVDADELTQRAARARISERILARDNLDAQSEDEEMMRNALSTMTLDDGAMGLQHGKVVDSLAKF